MSDERLDRMYYYTLVPNDCTSFRLTALLRHRKRQHWQRTIRVVHEPLDEKYGFFKLRSRFRWETVEEMFERLHKLVAKRIKEEVARDANQERVDEMVRMHNDTWEAWGNYSDLSYSRSGSTRDEAGGSSSGD